MAFGSLALAHPRADQPLTPADQIHQPFHALLKKYVSNHGVRYKAWKQNPQDLQQLENYIRALEAIRPDTLSRPKALAYWINLYNAATLNLVLKHYPVKSIKDVRNFFLSPWKLEVVEVAGKALTLDDIENAILRPKFQDARIHFALNCASASCPPLAAHAYLPSRIERQLDEAVQAALAQRRYVDIRPDAIRLSKIFSWYAEDFKKSAGSVRRFIAKYLPRQRQAILDPHRQLEYMPYDWQLNEAR